MHNLIEKKKYNKHTISMKFLREKYKFTKYQFSLLIKKFGFTSTDMEDLFRWERMLENILKLCYDWNRTDYTYSLKPEMKFNKNTNLNMISKKFNISIYKIKNIIKLNQWDYLNNYFILEEKMSSILDKEKDQFSIKKACLNYNLTRYKVLKIIKECKLDQSNLTLVEFEKCIKVVFETTLYGNFTIETLSKSLNTSKNEVNVFLHKKNWKLKNLDIENLEILAVYFKCPIKFNE